MAPTGLVDFDKLAEDHKARLSSEIQAYDQQKQQAERVLSQTQETLSETQTELTKVQQQLAHAHATQAQRQADWDASIKRIQATLTERETRIATEEKALGARQVQATKREDWLKHRAVILAEAIGTLTAQLATFKHQGAKLADEAVAAVKAADPAPKLPSAPTS